MPEMAIRIPNSEKLSFGVANQRSASDETHSRSKRGARGNEQERKKRAYSKLGTFHSEIFVLLIIY